MSDSQSTNYTVCYEAIEIYRNALITEIRKCLRTFDKVRELFTREEIERELSHARIPRDTQKIKSQLTDEYDCLSVNHIYNIVDKYFDELFPQFSSSSTNEKKSNKDDILRYVKE